MQTALILDLRQVSETSAQQLAERLDRTTKTLAAIQAEAVSHGDLRPSPSNSSSSSSRYDSSKLLGALECSTASYH